MARMFRLRACLTPVVLALATWSAGAQTVYKCQSDNAIVYSHEPCLGAAVVDTRPTEGMDKSSGQSRKGADVRKSETNKATAKAMEPLLGETAEQLEKRHRRFKLTVEARQECAKLDGVLTVQETEARSTGKAAAPNAEQRLLESRKRFRELRC